MLQRLILLRLNVIEIIKTPVDKKIRIFKNIFIIYIYAKKAVRQKHTSQTFIFKNIRDFFQKFTLKTHELLYSGNINSLTTQKELCVLLYTLFTRCEMKALMPNY